MIERAAAIEKVLRMPRIWRGQDIAPARALRTGYPSLDALLPGHGWPIGVLIEIIPVVEAVGEIELVLPLLRKVCAAHREVVFVRPPYMPYAPAVAKAGLPLNRVGWIDLPTVEEAHWAAEQALHEAAAGAVLLWSHIADDTALRRLQLAARDGDTHAFLYRPPQAIKRSSPAAVRIAVRPEPEGFCVEVLKAQGGRTAILKLTSSEDA